MTTRRSIAWILLLGLTLTWSAHVWAQPALRARVELLAPAPNRDALSASLRELAAEAGVSVEVSRTDSIDLPAILAARAPESEGLLARAWLRVVPPEALLVLSDQTGERLLLRRIDVGDALGPVEVESLAQILASSLEALRLGGEIGVTRAEVTESVTRPAQPPAPLTRQDTTAAITRPATTSPQQAAPARYLGEIEVADQASLWSARERPQHRVSLRGVLALNRALHPALVLEVGYLVPNVVSRGDVGARLEGLALRAGVSLRGALGRLSLRARLMAGLDLLHVEPRLLNPAALQVRPASWTQLGMLELAAGLDYRVLPRASLLFELGATLDLDAIYVVERSGGAETTFNPYRLRPFASFGLRVALDAP
ncbi:MAG: hypothetical protein GXP55_23015 [Deltaproteobacteria bacterium]|nr:hypothetical protein [Deltaproteobacteria bacterium]